jgi:hypothetical protein
MSPSIISAEALPDVVRSLTTLAQELGLTIHVTVPPSTPVSDAQQIGDDEQLHQQHCRDLIWLQRKYKAPDGSYPKLAGNYVAVYNEQIIAMSDTEIIARAGAAKELSLDPDRILVVPICVKDSESQDRWENIKRQLRID